MYYGFHLFVLDIGLYYMFMTLLRYLTMQKYISIYFLNALGNSDLLSSG